jgi:toxin YhaV
VTTSRQKPLIVKGWSIVAHPKWLEKFELWIASVDERRAPDRARPLAALTRLAFGTLPENPLRSEYRAPEASGDEDGHWYCAEYWPQSRLFFRCDPGARLLIYAWFEEPMSDS